MKNYKIEIKWGLIFVAMLLVWMVLEKVTGLHGEYIDKHYIYTNFIAFPAIAIYYFALQDKRKNFYNGIMSYKQGFISGVVITIIVTLFVPLTQYIISEIISPEYFQNVIAYTVSEGLQSQAEAENYFNMQSYIMQGLIGTPVMGIITTALVAIFTRKGK